MTASTTARFITLDQVEILRGPNALLFGRGGAGGVVNRVTKKAAPAVLLNSVRSVAW